MPALPQLTDWPRTARGLHEAAQLLGAIRQLVREPVANYLELALRIEAAGLSSEQLPTGGLVLLDFTQAALIYQAANGHRVTLPINGQSQHSLLETLLGAMNEHGDQLVQQSVGQTWSEAFFGALDARGHVFKPKAGELRSEAILAVDPASGAAYAEALYRVFTAVARFRARLAGPQTPIVVWPEHFDLSTLWFPSNDRSDEAQVINFGFAPFDATNPRPYLYIYAYPMPEGFERLELPAPARWHTEGWKGAFVSYDELCQSENPEALIEALCEQIYALLAPTLKRA